MDPIIKDAKVTHVRRTDTSAADSQRLLFAHYGKFAPGGEPLPLPFGTITVHLPADASTWLAEQPVSSDAVFRDALAVLEHAAGINTPDFVTTTSSRGWPAPGASTGKNDALDAVLNTGVVFPSDYKPQVHAVSVTGTAARPPGVAPDEGFNVLVKNLSSPKLPDLLARAAPDGTFGVTAFTTRDDVFSFTGIGPDGVPGTTDTTKGEDPWKPRGLGAGGSARLSATTDKES